MSDLPLRLLNLMSALFIKIGVVIVEKLVAAQPVKHSVSWVYGWIVADVVGAVHVYLLHWLLTSFSWDVHWGAFQFLQFLRYFIVHFLPLFVSKRYWDFGGRFFRRSASCYHFFGYGLLFRSWFFLLLFRNQLIHLVYILNVMLLLLWRFFILVGD